MPFRQTSLWILHCHCLDMSTINTLFDYFSSINSSKSSIHGYLFNNYNVSMVDFIYQDNHTRDQPSIHNRSLASLFLFSFSNFHHQEWLFPSLRTDDIPYGFKTPYFIVGYYPAQYSTQSDHTTNGISNDDDHHYSNNQSLEQDGNKLKQWKYFMLNGDKRILKMLKDSYEKMVILGCKLNLATKYHLHQAGKSMRNFILSNLKLLPIIILVGTGFLFEFVKGIHLAWSILLELWIWMISRTTITIIKIRRYE
ncbi:uncharacterized protein BX664DRAFT_310307 [Halteromyces radiatus]|uniref:uncharacterized protein n=1 Tax=Halteromyces radiatus TaxID=101107 RepID=UPI00221FF7B0|nr:uncharacterized protein BX664DRAFT_310307 [Halteromyces radiatus]KAI8099320.1 hypothetical protein BX664DRAFT_310307 [Halteromyces radiatus]